METKKYNKIIDAIISEYVDRTALHVISRACNEQIEHIELRQHKLEQQMGDD